MHTESDSSLMLSIKQLEQYNSSETKQFACGELTATDVEVILHRQVD
jgi:hypothetical protein